MSKTPRATLARTPKEKIEQVVKLYQEGKSQTYIGNTLRMTRRTIRKILEDNEIKRSKSEQFSISSGVSTRFNQNAFDEVSDDMAYWLGFLYADGYITNPKNTHAVGVLLKAEDKGHIEKLRDFLESEHKIYNLRVNDKHPGAQLKIGSKYLHEKLQEWGMTWTKSYDAKPPEVMKYNRHFWRGVFDGDGHIGTSTQTSKGYTYDNCRFALVGTQAIVSAFRTFLIESKIDFKAEIRQPNGTNYSKFETQGSYNVKKAMQLLYRDANVYLDRKYKIYCDYFKQN